LIEDLALGTIDEPLENDRTIANPAHGTVGDGKVVPNDLELGELRVLREVRFGRVGDADLLARNRQHFGWLFRRHESEVT
jgi:hypothetical protein